MPSRLSMRLSPLLLMCFPYYYYLFVLFLFHTSPRISSSCNAMMIPSTATKIASVTSASMISEGVWRKMAQEHSNRIYKLLQPGLIDNACTSNDTGNRRTQRKDRWSAIDSNNPVYNFLEEYYGVKGAKGVRRLGRWSPGLSFSSDGSVPVLAGARDDDVCGGCLHMRGFEFVYAQHEQFLSEDSDTSIVGVRYDPRQYFSHLVEESLDNRTSKAILASPFVWYRRILTTTQNNDPVTHCHGLHEWAMLYRPNGAPPPPSTKYQSHLPLRVDQIKINAAVERRGVSCTHVDALRFFAKDALPLNREGALLREDQIRMEQPACVHANMDLLKIALRLSPWIDSRLIADALEVAIEARKLDIAASPYDVSVYGFQPIKIENSQGRDEYRERQRIVMNKAAPVRQELLNAYDEFIDYTFGEDVTNDAENQHLPTSNSFSRSNF